MSGRIRHTESDDRTGSIGFESGVPADSALQSSCSWPMGVETGAPLDLAPGVSRGPES